MALRATSRLFLQQLQGLHRLPGRPLAISIHPKGRISSRCPRSVPAQGRLLCDGSVLSGMVLHPCTSGNRASLQGAEEGFWGWMKTAPAPPPPFPVLELWSCDRRELPRSSPRGGTESAGCGGSAGRGIPVPGREGSADAFAPPGRWERAARTPPAVPGLRSPPRPGRAGVARGGMSAVPWRGLRGTPRRASRR